MSDLPKLQVKWWGRWERVIDFEQAKSLLPFGHYEGVRILVEGQAVNSYEELVQLAAQDCHKDKELLELAVIMPVSGG